LIVSNDKVYTVFMLLLLLLLSPISVDLFSGDYSRLSWVPEIS